nr:hypothetical protein [Lachnospiraceae bacterium]
DVYSETLGDTFSVRIGSDGTDMYDDYDMHLYYDDIEQEIGSVAYDENGWSMRKLTIDRKGLTATPGCEDIAGYKSDRDRLLIVIKVDIDEDADDMHMASESLYAYVNSLHDLGYRWILDIYRGDNITTLEELSDDSVITEADLAAALGV